MDRRTASSREEGIGSVMNNGQILFDTNVVSYMMKGGRLAEAYAPHLERRLRAIAFITVGEMYSWAERGNWGEPRRKELETTLGKFVVIPYNHEVARCYGRIMTGQRKQRRTIATNDAWIAACAVRHGFPLVTHNAKDFEGVSSLEVITEQVD